MKYSTLSNSTCADWSFCRYCSYTRAAQLSRGVFHLDIAISWFRVISIFCVYWSLFAFYQGCWRTRRLLIRTLCSWRSWWSRRHRVKNTITVVTETVLEAFLEDFQTWDYLFLLLMYQGFHSISIQVKGIILYIKERMYNWNINRI